jgi:hypothetical protein
MVTQCYSLHCYECPFSPKKFIPEFFFQSPAVPGPSLISTARYDAKVCDNTQWSGSGGAAQDWENCQAGKRHGTICAVRSLEGRK